MLSLDGITSYHFATLLLGIEYMGNEEQTWIHDDLEEKGIVSWYFGWVSEIVTMFQDIFPEAIKRLVPDGVLRPEIKGYVDDYRMFFEEQKKLYKCQDFSFCT